MQSSVLKSNVSLKYICNSFSYTLLSLMPSQLKQVLLALSENTSFHGVSHTSNERHTKWTTLAWILAFTLTFVVYVYVLCGTLMIYYNYPTQTNVEDRITDAIKFPSVTICNINVDRYSAIIRNKYAMHVFKKLLQKLSTS